ncbi:hypothetical protein [Aureibacter tunicatorum]|uniref:Uncharacterized protein n=1 Tax=Aureibacter tunicatorum TaxID=866807 RepID=A0AAE3XN41_9BACT|nr:hypothetical protein [Aureibacter tunicatorum]MDR6240002.1 hypothetical protein [Aureibacter tunicatorum]BDD04474.1 hypothetical protein AUTU_19570 [Aureibacter tunicatorum]
MHLILDAPYNDIFWDFLNYKAREEFIGDEFDFVIIYPWGVDTSTLFNSRKNSECLISAKTVFFKGDEEFMYDTVIKLGTYSQRVYHNMKGYDVKKCYKLNGKAGWANVNRNNRTVSIVLK